MGRPGVRLAHDVSIVGGMTLLAALAIRLLFPQVAPAGAVGMRERLSYLEAAGAAIRLADNARLGHRNFCALYVRFRTVCRIRSWRPDDQHRAVHLRYRQLYRGPDGGIAADRIGPNRAIPLALILLAASLFLMSALYGFAGRPGILAVAIAAMALYGLQRLACLILPSSIG
ncbi:hypothetical protein VQ056_14985 [Paenibacillus sp. JTLBN-2024]